MQLNQIISIDFLSLNIFMAILTLTIDRLTVFLIYDIVYCFLIFYIYKFVSNITVDFHYFNLFRFYFNKQASKQASK